MKGKVLTRLFRRKEYEWGNEKLRKAYNCWRVALISIMTVLVCVMGYVAGIRVTGNLEPLKPEWSVWVCALGVVGIIVIICVVEGMRYADKAHKEQ